MGKSSSIRAQPKHKCSCCGKIGHNIKQCPAPAAKELIHLRAAVKGFLDGRPQKRPWDAAELSGPLPSGHVL